MSITEHKVTNTEMEKDRDCTAKVTCICGGVWERPSWDPDGESLPIWLAQHDREAFLDAKAGAEYRRVMAPTWERQRRARTKDRSEWEKIETNDPVPTWDWEAYPVMIGIFQGSRTVTTVNGDSKIHHFTDAVGYRCEDALLDRVGGMGVKLAKEIVAINNVVAIELAEVDSWGTAMLNPRLAEVEPGTKVKVISTGRRIPTKGGKAKEFWVLVAR